MESINKQKKILVLEPFFGGSHKVFLEELVSHSRHEFKLLTLSPHHWKWRVRSSPVVFSEMATDLDEEYDVLFFSDFLDLPGFLGFCGDRFTQAAKVCYFHENQLSYPSRTKGERDLHFGFSNITTALASDELWFNSEWNRTSFFDESKRLISRMPDNRPSFDIGKATAKVIYPGVSLPRGERAVQDEPLVILWNHRWEHDKNPEEFFEAIRRLDRDFRLIVCGQEFSDSPHVFLEAKAEFSSKIIHFGYCKDRAEYLNLVRRSDVVVSTAVHEFFGLSVVEAIGLGCFPLLPNRLSYPELVPKGSDSLYRGVDDLVAKLSKIEKSALPDMRAEFSKFEWKNRIDEFDDGFSRVAETKPQ